MLKNEEISALIFMLISTSFAVIVSVMVKILSEELSTLQIVFLRNIFAVILIAITIYKAPFKNSDSTKKPFLLLTRGILGFLGLLTYFYAIGNISLATAISLNKTSPIFAAIFSFIFLREKISIKGVFAILIAFSGVILILQPKDFNFNKAHIIALIGGALAGAAYTSIKELKNYYDTRVIVLSFATVGFISPLILTSVGSYFNVNSSFMLSKFTYVDTNLWIYVIAMGFCGTVSQFFLTKSYSYSKTAIVGTFGYSSIILSLIVDKILFKTTPNILAIFGIILIIIGGINIAKEGKKNKE